MRIYHISDLHIRGDMKHNKVVADALKKLQEAVHSEDFVVITGDITDDGKDGQYRNATDLLKPLSQQLPVGHLIMVPGNHDYGIIGTLYSKACADRFHKLKSLLTANQQSVDLGNGRGVEFLHLDTCLRTGSVVDLAQGKVGWWRRLRLKQELERIRKKKWTSVVLMHHSPLCTDWWLRLQDAQQFLGVVLGRAGYVLFGHTHGVASQHYPMGLPEDQAQTWMYDAGALFQGKGPHVLEIGGAP